MKIEAIVKGKVEGYNLSPKGWLVTDGAGVEYMMDGEICDAEPDVNIPHPSFQVHTIVRVSDGAVIDWYSEGIEAGDAVSIAASDLVFEMTEDVR